MLSEFLDNKLRNVDQLKEKRKFKYYLGVQ